MESNNIVGLLESVYDHAVDGIVGITGAVELGDEYLRDNGDVESAITQLIRWQVGQAAVIGFGTNIGGLLTMPIAIPANLAGALAIQIRMVAAIAHLRGYDVRSNPIRTFAIMCLMGNAAVEVLKEFGIQLGTKLTTRVISQISRQTLIKINQAVGFRLFTKAGTTGAANLIKWVPLVGGLVGGTIDAFATQAIAEIAKKAFPMIGDAGPNQGHTIEGEVVS